MTTSYTVNPDYLLDGCVGWEVSIPRRLVKGKQEGIGVEVGRDGHELYITVVRSDADIFPPVGTRVPRRFILDPTMHPSMLGPWELDLYRILLAKCRDALRKRGIHHTHSSPGGAKFRTGFFEDSAGSEREIRTPGLMPHGYTLESVGMKVERSRLRGK